MRTLLCALLLALWWLPAVASAQGSADEAEVNFWLGTDSYQRGDYRAALAHFLASDRLAGNANVKFNIVRTFQRLGQFPEAYRWCVAALRSEPAAELSALLEQSLSAIAREVAVVEVESDPPGATVYLDRRDLGALGATPATLAVAPGAHRFLLEHPGFMGAGSELLTVAKGEQKKLKLSLARIVGRIEVTVPSGTSIRVDAEDGPVLGQGPTTLALPPGPHVLFFDRPGYRLNPRHVLVEAQQTLAVHADALPKLGSLLITARQAGALIEVDGQPSGFAPAVLGQVPVGPRRVRVSMRGFVAAERVFEVEEGVQSSWTDVDLRVLEEVSAAGRVPQGLREAAASVSVVRREELRAFRYPTIAEALRGQRGVALASDGAYTNLTLRGLGQPGDYGNRVLVLSDGATLNDNILWQSYLGYDARVDLDDVERIELVRGPGSVLYGTGAVSGVVNLVPRAAPTRYEGEARITASDARTARGRARGGMPLGKHGGLWLSAAGAHSAGSSLTLPTGSTRTRVERVGAFDAATLNSRLELSDLTVQGFFTLREQELPNGAYGARLGDRRNDLRDRRGLLEARYEPQLGTRAKLYSRVFGNFYGFDSVLVYDGAAPAAPDVFKERYLGDWVGGEARFVVQAARTLTLTAGSEVQVNERAKLVGSVAGPAGEQRYLRVDRPYEIYAAYALCEWTPVSAASFSLGGRVDAWSTFGATFNPRVNVILRPSEHDTIKLFGGRAYRAPSTYEISYTDAGRTQVASNFDGSALEPEVVWSGELEATHAFADSYVALLALHGQRATHLIEQALVTPADPESVVYYRNGKRDLTVLGGDAELRRELLSGWMMAASYGALWTRYDQAAGLGHRALGVPAHYASARSIIGLARELSLALRGTLEAPRWLVSSPARKTAWAAITDIVLSGTRSELGLDYAVGVYNLFDFQLALPTDSTFIAPTMPQLGRTLLLSVGISR